MLVTLARAGCYYPVDAPFVASESRRLLRPWRWLPLQVGKVDFAPILSIVLVVVSAEFAQRGLAQLYQKLI